MQTRRKLLLAAAILVPVGAGGAGAAWWYLKDDAPPAVDLETAVQQVADAADDTTTTAGDTTTTDAATGTTGTTAPADDTTTTAATEAVAADVVSGTWTVDTETGDFDYETSTGTFAGFRIQEELASIGSTTAVGRTGDVSGTITIDGTTLTAASFEVDLTTITTNDDRRNDKVQDALETGEFPTATFMLTEPIDLGESAATGEAVAVTAVGELTIHGVTQTVSFPLEAQLVEGTIVVVGSLDLTFSDYGVAVPESQIVVSVEDHGVLEVQLLLTAA
jgi:polyisoprenoid-binding protein YceI